MVPGGGRCGRSCAGTMTRAVVDERLGSHDGFHAAIGNGAPREYQTTWSGAPHVAHTPGASLGS